MDSPAASAISASARSRHPFSAANSKAASITGRCASDDALALDALELRFAMTNLPCSLKDRNSCPAWKVRPLAGGGFGLGDLRDLASGQANQIGRAQAENGKGGAGGGPDRL